MSETKNVNFSCGGIGFLLTIVFMVLKLCGVIAWSWLWVFMPLIVSVGLVIFVLLITFLIAIVCAVISSRY